MASVRHLLTIVILPVKGGKILKYFTNFVNLYLLFKERTTELFPIA